MDWGSLLGNAASLLGSAGGQGQQQPAAVSSPPQQKDSTSLQRQLAIARKIQQLRAKPRKTLAEQQELQELMRQQMGQH
jgi:hypothetical protein